MKKLILSFLLLCGVTHADGCITLPDLGFACFTNDALAIPDFTHPYFQVSNSVAAVYPSSMSFPNPGMISPYVTFSSSSIPCDGAHAGSMKYDNGHLMCGGTSWDSVVSGTSLVSMTSRIGNDEAIIVANNASATTSLTGKASAASLTIISTSLTNTSNSLANTSATVSTLSSSIVTINGNITALSSTVAAKLTNPLGNNSQVILGDGTLGTLPSTLAMYSGSSLLSSPKMILNNGITNSGGAVVFQLTTNGTSSGTAIMSNPVGVNIDINSNTAAYGYAYVFSNTSRTLTVSVTQPTSLLSLGLLPNVAASAGVPINIRVFGN